MIKSGEWKAAFAITAAAAGVGFASGREMVLFFAQLGRAAWPGIICASALFGMLTAMTVYFAQKTGESSFSGVYRHMLGRGAGSFAGLLHGLLMAFVAAMMLDSAGELGALALPVKHGYLQGALTAALIALLFCMNKMRLLPMMGMLVAAASVLFYGGLFLDMRPVRVYIRYETQLMLEGSVGAAMLLAILYACLNASATGGIAAVFSDKDVRPGRTGFLSACIICVMLAFAQLAMLRGGRDIYGQALPTVILAARWGIAGFWISVLFMYLCTAATLSAAIGSLLPGESGGCAGAALIPAAFLTVCAAGKRDIIGLVFPFFAWVSAFFLLVMICFSGREEGMHRRGKAG